jgi:hypothetical protein
MIAPRQPIILRPIRGIIFGYGGDDAKGLDVGGIAENVVNVARYQSDEVSSVPFLR